MVDVWLFFVVDDFGVLDASLVNFLLWVLGWPCWCSLLLSFSLLCACFGCSLWHSVKGKAGIGLLLLRGVVLNRAGKMFVENLLELSDSGFTLVEQILLVSDDLVGRTKELLRLGQLEQGLVVLVLEVVGSRLLLLESQFVLLDVCS